MKKILSLLLVVVLALSMAACGNNVNPNGTEGSSTPSTENNTPSSEASEPSSEATEPSSEASEPSESTGEVVTGNAVTSFSMSINVDWVPTYSVYIADNGDGTVYVDYLGEVRKMSFGFDGAVLADIAAALANVDLTTLGESVYEDGTTSCGLSVAYADGNFFMYDYAGAEVPAAFAAIKDAMDVAVQAALADLEVYVPQAMVDTMMGEIDAAILPEVQAVINNAGLSNLEMMVISNIPVDESFAFTAGLSTADGITAGANCTSMMMGGAVYQLVVVTADDTAAVAADFEASMDWGKWVCVRPHNAIIATKGNMVLCLMSDSSMYAGTVTAIQNAGWTTVTELTDPGM